MLLSDKHNVALIKHLNVSNILETNRLIDQNSLRFGNFNTEIDGTCEMEMEKIETQTNFVCLNKEKRRIFKTVSLKPCLANQIRKDNLHRS